MARPDAMVLIVDDDPSMRETLGRLFRSVGLQVRLFAAVPELLLSNVPEVDSCLVLDVRLPGLDGFELQAELAKRNICIPIIFITGHGDVPMSVRAMKSGAIDFLIKPFREQDLLEAVNRALDQDGNGLKKKAKESFAELARMVGEVQKKGCGST